MNPPENYYSHSLLIAEINLIQRNNTCSLVTLSFIESFEMMVYRLPFGVQHLPLRFTMNIESPITITKISRIIGITTRPMNVLIVYDNRNDLPFVFRLDAYALNSLVQQTIQFISFVLSTFIRIIL